MVCPLHCALNLRCILSDCRVYRAGRELAVNLTIRSHAAGFILGLFLEQ